MYKSNYYFYCARIKFANRKMLNSRKYLIKSISNNPFKIISIIYFILSFLPKYLLDFFEIYWLKIKIKYRVDL